jgi:hypothetical protein
VSSHREPATAADLQAATAAILAKIEDSKKGSRQTNIILQTALTAVIGLVVWRAQQTVSQGIHEENARLANQLTLSQDYFKQRMSVYAELYHAAIAVRDVAQQMQDSPESLNSLKLASFDLYDKKNKDYLYASEDLLDLSQRLWFDAMLVSQNRDQKKAFQALQDIQQLVDDIGTKMRAELAIKTLEAIEASIAADVEAQQAKKQKTRR